MKEAGRRAMEGKKEETLRTKKSERKLRHEEERSRESGKGEEQELGRKKNMSTI